jgi:hypothetical protein
MVRFGVTHGVFVQQAAAQTPLMKETAGGSVSPRQWK